MRDIVVIGAGPAGSIAAQRLAGHGHDVVMLEEHETIGTPVHCTGLLGDEAFDEFDLPRPLILARASAACFWGAAGRSVSIASARVRASIVDRAGLDAVLADRARAAGAEVIRGCRAETVGLARGHVLVTTENGGPPIEARACVLACGANYRFHGALGLGKPDVFLQSAQIETPFPEMPGIEVRFGREVAPAGFAWIVPFQRDGGTRARIGLMSESRAGERFKLFLRSLYERVGQVPGELPAPRLKMLPLGPVPRTYGERVVAVGDAAGLVKPTTGGGIYYGLLSGAMAAEVLAEGLRRDRLDAAWLGRYESRWRRRLGPEIRMGLAFRKMASRLGDESIDALIDLAKVNGVVPLLQETASFNWHRKAAMALLAHPAFRKIVFRSWAGSAGPL